MVVDADEAEEEEEEVHGLEGVEGVDTRTMVIVMEETDGERMFDVSFTCIDSIDCCCSGVYRL